MKKTKRLFGLFFMVFTLLAVSLSAFANSDIETQYGITQTQIEEYIEGLIGQLQMLSDDELEQYKSMGDEVVATWMEIYDGIGGFEEILGDKATYEMTDEGFTGEIPVKMENKEIIVKLDFLAATGTVDVVFSEGGTDSAMGLGSILKKAGINTLIGMGTVFVMLVFISLLIWLLGFVPKLFGGKKEEKTAAPAAAAPAAVPAEKQTSTRESAKTDDQELVAVIAAAIAAATGTSTDSFVVRSIRRVKRS